MAQQAVGVGVSAARPGKSIDTAGQQQQQQWQVPPPSKAMASMTSTVLVLALVLVCWEWCAGGADVLGVVCSCGVGAGVLMVAFWC